MEITDVIKSSAKEISIDSKKDEETKQKNSDDRKLAIQCVDLLIDRELFWIEEFIGDMYADEFPEDEEVDDDTGFDDKMDKIDHNLLTVERLAKVRAYLQARDDGMSGD
jgi:hypothetical protein